MDTKYEFMLETVANGKYKRAIKSYSNLHDATNEFGKASHSGKWKYGYLYSVETDSNKNEVLAYFSPRTKVSAKDAEPQD